MRYLWGHGVGHTYTHLDAPEDPNHDGSTGEIDGDGTVDMGSDGQESLGDKSDGPSSLYDDREDTLENIEEEELDVDGGSDSGDSNATSDWPEPDDSDEE